MQITFHGAARTVTGSMHLIEVNGSHLLLECGLFQGARRENYERNRNFPFDVRGIDAVILSHAHIDHSGNLPHLVNRAFRAPSLPPLPPQVSLTSCYATLGTSRRLMQPT